MRSDHPQLVVIEDNPADIQLIKIARNRNGVECDLRQYVRGIDAVRELCTPEDARDAVPDAILMDLNTPGTDGFDALRILRGTARLSAVPIAVLTSSRCPSDRQRARALGVT